MTCIFRYPVSVGAEAVSMPMLEVLAFLGLVAVISLSGVLLPGPMTAATIVKSYTDKWAGAKVAIGHAFVEMPLVALIALGSTFILDDDSGAIVVIGLLGGAYLLVLGSTIVLDKGFIREDEEEAEKFSRNAVTIGVATTLLNPAFHVWWITIGVFLVTQATEYGLIILIVFAAVHWLTDLGWGIAISFSIQKVKQFYASRAKEVIRYVCAAIILVFGAYFAISSGYEIIVG